MFGSRSVINIILIMLLLLYCFASMTSSDSEKIFLYLLLFDLLQCERKHYAWGLKTLIVKKFCQVFTNALQVVTVRKGQMSRMYKIDYLDRLNNYPRLIAV